MKTEHTTFNSFTTSVIALKLMVYSFWVVFVAPCWLLFHVMMFEWRKRLLFSFSLVRSPLRLPMISVWLVSLAHNFQLVSQLVYYQTFIMDAAATTEFESGRDARIDRVARTLFKLISHLLVSLRRFFTNLPINSSEKWLQLTAANAQTENKISITLRFSVGSTQ